MSNLRDLTKQRATIRGRLTNFDKYLEPLMTCKEVSDIQLNELRLRCEKVRDLSCNFDDIQTQIELLEEDTSKQIQEREITESSFFNSIAKAQSLLDFFGNKINRAGSSSNSTKNICNLKLPPIRISNYGGDPNQWISFRDTYLSLIHENDNIDDVNKFHYLKSYLEGAASAVISSVTVSSANYQIAWNLLCQRYDNKRLLINEHIKCIFTISQLQKESEQGIRDLNDTLSKNLSVLKSLGEPTDKWDTLIIYMASAKLDSLTARNWEEFRSDKDSPTLEQFYSFLRQRATVLETINAGKCVKNERRHSLSHTNSFIAANIETSPGKKCPFCKQNHRLFECVKFKLLPVPERMTKITMMKLCSNCLRSGHQTYQCRLLSGCRICHRRHNTLLHRQGSLPSASNIQINTNDTNINETNSPDPVVDVAASGPSTSVSMSAVTTNQALLSTALVKVMSHDKFFILRALLDSGSQSSFISERAQREIGSCKGKDNYHCVSGIGNTLMNITEHCTIHLHSMHNSFETQIKCFILPKITERLPHVAVRKQDLGIPSHVQLADPTFYQPSEIDLLLGADVFWDLVRSPRITLGPKMPILQDTHLGWIIAGSMSSSLYENNSTIHCNFSQDISDQLSKFWELEEVPSSNEINNKDYCETLFNETTRRESDGRFCVQIPLKDSVGLLGESYNIAEKRLLQLERKFKNKPQLKQQYTEFIHEYERLGHMTEITKPTFGYYLPHHAVIRENSETTKLRVVFDASSKTSTGVSFNDIQQVGPVVQDDLFSILLRYRQHKYAASADVEKMYRQIMISHTQRNLQLILWRNDPSQPIRVFQLNTVTYGTASAPYLSTRCLLQLSRECGNDIDVSQAIQHDFYVDDFLSGAQTESSLERLITSVTAKLGMACLPLRKWRTNAPAIFKNDSNTVLPKNLDISSQSSVLGLKWDPSKDVLQFPVDIEVNSNITKRIILSNSAKLFDPLGLLSPCTIIPKIILQKLWLTKLDWDDSVDSLLEREWLNFTSNLNCISNIEIPRCVINADSETIQLHSFSDASQVAYAAAVYIRSKDNSGRSLVRLLCAKTKVAPIKAISIPRLELCGALLSARLSHKVLKTLRCHIDSVFHWTDSTVVLSWLASQSYDLLLPIVSVKFKN